MSTAYFIVLDRDDTDFDSFVDGKMLTRQLAAVNNVASKLDRGLNRIKTKERPLAAAVITKPTSAAVSDEFSR